MRPFQFQQPSPGQDSRHKLAEIAKVAIENGHPVEKLQPQRRLVLEPLPLRNFRATQKGPK